jgi:hypothetical protein
LGLVILILLLEHRWKPKFLIFWGVAVISFGFILLFSIYYSAPRQDRENTAFHSLYFGVLAFSENPIKHLDELNLTGTEGCINKPAFSDIGNLCIAKIHSQMSYSNTAKVILSEPKVISRLFAYVSGNMQNYWPNLSFCNLDSDAICPPSGLLNIWNQLKSNWFPSGNLFWVGFVLLLIIASKGLRYPGIVSDLGWICLICLTAMIMDMVIAFLGDGKQEIVKHLFLSNLLFDLAAIFGLNIGILWGYQKVTILSQKYF